jgi:hypothetical protein
MLLRGEDMYTDKIFADGEELEPPTLTVAFTSKASLGKAAHDGDLAKLSRHIEGVADVDLRQHFKQLLGQGVESVIPLPLSSS